MKGTETKNQGSDLFKATGHGGVPLVKGTETGDSRSNVIRPPRATEVSPS